MVWATSRRLSFHNKTADTDESGNSYRYGTAAVDQARMGGASGRIPHAGTGSHAGRGARLVQAAGRDALREFSRGFVVPAQAAAHAFPFHLCILPYVRRSG